MHLSIFCQSKFHKFMTGIGSFILLISLGLNAYAAPDASEDYLSEAEERKLLPIESNQIENWPAGPAIGAESAILLEANTGVILYAKNIDERLYPASTTKLMTCLIAAEKCQLNEMISFSHDAVFSLEPGSSNMGIDEGQSMPLEECLYGILVASANEVANAVAEHVAGSRDAFAEMMNEKAAELGCKNTHFVNAHGLHDDDHYVSAYDLALIAKAFFQNELLAKIANTASYHFMPTNTQPDDFFKRNKHQLVSGEIPYEGIKGGKTGYTDLARETLVTCAEQNGMKLICVVLKEESPEQFYDTVKLFDYGFTNFAVANVAENETRYSIRNSNFFNTSSDVFGNSSPILSLNQDSYLIMPKNITFDELDSEISYDTEDENQVAVIEYHYHGAYLGTATLDLAGSSSLSYEFTENSDTVINTEDQNVIVVNIKLILICVLAIAVIVIAIIIIRSFVRSYQFHNNRQLTRKRKRNKKNRKGGPHFPSSRFDSFSL
ncbi:MAG: D-alanyl-D-alanine carboxypeptidase [Lachnospiraceae bacterium]|nr:D-alanyl-D-alanine carboxypeptidase [Lachnospiraceae bacterium]